MKILTLLVFMLIFGAGRAPVLMAQQVRMQKAVVGDAGGQASNGTVRLSYTVGQPAAGSATNGSTNGKFGFWNSGSVPASVSSNPGAGTIESVQIIPNPATSDITIIVKQSTAGPLDLGLYDAAGRRSATLFTGNKGGGTFSLHYTVSSLASGTYFVTARMPDAIVESRLTVVR